MEKTLKIKSSSDSLLLDVLIKEADKPKGIIAIAHGMVEHKERYIPFMDFLAENGYISIIYDHRGHGESIKDSDDLGYFYDDDAKYIVDDLNDIITYAAKEYNLPVYLFGHSMGSLVVRNYIAKYGNNIEKLIVCGTPYNNPFANFGVFLCGVMSKFKGDRYRSKFVTNMVVGHFDSLVEGDLENRWISYNEENIHNFNSNPKDGFVFTLNAYRNLFKLVSNTYNKKQTVINKDLPILFIAGEDDPVIGGLKKWQNSMLFMNDIGYHNIKSILYKHMRHEILNEKDNIAVFKDIIRFIQDEEFENVH